MKQNKIPGILCLAFAHGRRPGRPGRFHLRPLPFPGRTQPGAEKHRPGQRKINRSDRDRRLAGGKPLSMLYIGPEAGSKDKAPAGHPGGGQPGRHGAPGLGGGPVPDPGHRGKTRNAARTRAGISCHWAIPTPRQNLSPSPLHSGQPATAGRDNDDMDDRSDEDGAEDLDGNGIITMMRVKDPEGEWLPLEGEPRLMKKADPAKGEEGNLQALPRRAGQRRRRPIQRGRPRRRQYRRQFPPPVPFFTQKGGKWAGSESESLGLIRFVFQHPEIAMTVTFGESNFCLVPPRGGRKGEADFSKIKIPKRIGAFLNVDTRQDLFHGRGHGDRPQPGACRDSN